MLILSSASMATAIIPSHRTRGLQGTRFAPSPSAASQRSLTSSPRPHSNGGTLDAHRRGEPPMILGAEIGLPVMAIITLVRGKLVLTKNRVVYGTPARLLALFGL